MITRKFTIMALIFGIVLGAASTEGIHFYRQSYDSRIFQQRARCRAVADAYVKKNTDLSDSSLTGSSVILEKVDYSPARNSCVAELNSTYFAPGGGLKFYSVQDLLSGESLFTVDCNKDCIEVLLKMNWIDPAFDYVMKNADEPRDLEKAYVDVQSVLKSKTQSQPLPHSGQPPDFIPDTPSSQHKSPSPSGTVGHP